MQSGSCYILDWSVCLELNKDSFKVAEFWSEAVRAARRQLLSCCARILACGRMIVGCRTRVAEAKCGSLSFRI